MLLGIELLKNNKIQKFVGVENKNGPFFSAKKIVASLEKKYDISILFSDGLSSLISGDYSFLCLFDTLIMTGFGTKEILKILSDIPALTNLRTIVIEPRNNVWKIRKHFNNTEWKLSEEWIVKEKNTFYNVFKLLKTKQINILNEKQIYSGIDVKGKKEIINEYLEAKIHYLRDIVDFSKNKDLQKVYSYLLEKREN